MKTRRSAAVRLAASAMLAAAVMLGAHAFVPTAFGCSQIGGGSCREAQIEMRTISYLNLRLVLEMIDVLLP